MEITRETRAIAKPLATAGIVFGVGMGALFNGIFLQQLLQLHNLFSNWLRPDSVVSERLNMFWDGWFFATAWIVSAIGVSILWRAAKDGVPLQKNTFLGSCFLGWGAFILIEGIISHHVLQMHHVVDRVFDANVALWDATYLAVGVVAVVTGLWVRSLDRRAVIKPAARVQSSDLKPRPI